MPVLTGASVMLESSQPIVIESGKRRVIVCADDFAFNQSASLAMAKLAQMGRISAISAMVLSPRWAQDVALLQDLRDKVDVGLHLDWTSAFAVAAGHGMSLGQAMGRALLGGFDPRQAQKVITQQLDLFELHWQAPPDYVDGHQHVHQFAGIREALVTELMQRYGNLAVQPYLRISRAPVGLADIKSRIIAWMGADALEKIASCAGLPRARALFGVYNFAGDAQRYAALMKHWLAHASTGSILMCHPAVAAEPGDDIGAARVQEFGYLCESQFSAALEQNHWQIVRGREILTGT
jgi:predicted glycoside hydrolase/deacetylase ChbG (UPF0249 family)